MHTEGGKMNYFLMTNWIQTYDGFDWHDCLNQNTCFPIYLAWISRSCFCNIQLVMMRELTGPKDRWIKKVQDDSWYRHTKTNLEQPETKVLEGRRLPQKAASGHTTQLQQLYQQRTSCLGLLCNPGNRTWKVNWVHQKYTEVKKLKLVSTNLAFQLKKEPCPAPY